jgi:murein DD-endopeptidase MepM/ murein hydrolase activator NlpD
VPELAPSPTLTAWPSSTVQSTQTPLPTQQSRRRCAPGAESCLLDWPFPLQSPIQSPGMGQIDGIYRYGATQDGLRKPHHGVDLTSAFGTPVYAAADGVAVVAGSDIETLVSPWPNFYGNVVVLEHHLSGVDRPVYTLYGHLSKVDTAPGEHVTAGEKIGEVGASGVALGSHLHFEVRLDADDYASSRNPELWLAPAGGTVAVRIANAEGKLIPTVLNVEFFIDPAGEVTETFPVEVYDTREKFPVNSDDVLGENFVLGSLPSGRYRLTFVYWGALYERWVDVLSGRLTYADFSVP